MRIEGLLGDATLFMSAAQRGKADVPMDPETLAMVLGSGVGVVLLIVGALLVIKKLLFVCGPHEILVFSGRASKLTDGSGSNFKILHGGRGFRIPLLEVVRRMDMRLFPVDVTVQNAYSTGGIPLTVRAIANVKLSSDDSAVRNAIERFLDYHPSQIAVAAQQTLEGVLREVISQLTPEEVNEDRLKFAETLMENAKDDFHKLGLELEVLKVQHVSDDQDYLSNLGRAVIANMLRDAENAENAANQAVAEAKAQAREDAETATKVAETKVVEARNLAGAELANLEAEAKEAENQASMAAETARVRAEQRLQELRAQLEKLRLHCDVVLPAEAQRQASMLRARGEAAPAIENGKAAAEALKAVADEWARAGTAGRDVYVLQQLPALAQAAADRVAQSEIGNIKLVAGDDSSYSAVLASYPNAVARVLRETGDAIGLDIRRLLAPSEGNGAPVPPHGGGDDDGGDPVPTKRRTLQPSVPAPDESLSAEGPAPTRRAYGTRSTSRGMPSVTPEEEGGMQ
jgi:flotillin